MLDTTKANNYSYRTKELDIHVLGGIKLTHLERMRVTLSIKKPRGHHILRHSIDLYNDTATERLIRKVAERIEVGSSVVRQTLQKLTTALEQYRIDQLDKEQEVPVPRSLSVKERQRVIRFLKSKDLLSNTNELIGKSGVIGEDVNRLLMYLLFTSRKTSNPLHCISLGSSGVGKTHLQSKVAELIPEEDKVEITVLSANAFYYFNRTELRNKLILIEDMDGAESVLYPLRELQSKRRITKTVVHKDRKGTTKTIHLTVEGPVSVAGCTTRESIYEDNSNRSFLLYIDESSGQDQKIMQYQRLLSAGKVNKEEEYKAARFLRDVQRVLAPVTVRNPYAEFLELPSSVFKPRRTNSHYLQFIEAITFYKQHQRLKSYDEQTGEEYIETTIDDIEEANAIIKEVLLRKSDEITGGCRNYLERLKRYLQRNNQTTFRALEIRRSLKIKKTTQWRYHKQLIEHSYIKKQKKRKGVSVIDYQITNPNEYRELEESISKALQESIHKITCLSGADCSSVPERSTKKMEQINTSKQVT